jgi:hypothetical protein
LDPNETAVHTRAEVRMEIESVPGTSRDALTAIGAALGERLGAVKACYREVVEDRPQIEGSMRLRFANEPGRRHQVTIVGEPVGDPPLVRCVKQAFERGRFEGIPRGQAYIALTFSNGSADGVAHTQRRAAAEANVNVRRNAEGRPTASGGTPDGLVRFQVVGDANANPEQIAALQRTIRAHLAVFLDCRRHATRRGDSPDGDVRLDLQVRPRGRTRTRTLSQTVADDTAGRCIERGLGRVTFESGARGHAELVVHFASDSGT